jgi:undecaprenyl phosphate N,N'-diacetylbacillosamine 1-phosphate transferase
MYIRIIKPLFDFTAALILLVLVSPILLVSALLLLILNDGKVLFLQQRPGYKEKPFYIIKFKTMNDRKDKQGLLLPDKERLTAFGRFLRKSSIDELPQLINVLKGEMSFVGPRPLLMEYLPLYSEEQKLRHSVKPGITGWAQVNGRQQLMGSKKIALDVYYARHCSFALDLKILLKTVVGVFTSKGVVLEQDYKEVDDMGFMEAIKNNQLKNKK